MQHRRTTVTSHRRTTVTSHRRTIVTIHRCTTVTSHDDHLVVPASLFPRRSNLRLQSPSSLQQHSTKAMEAPLHMQQGRRTASPVLTCPLQQPIPVPHTCLSLTSLPSSAQNSSFLPPLCHGFCTMEELRTGQRAVDDDAEAEG